MRYRLRISRIQTFDWTVTAKDEQHAMGRVGQEMDRPYGLLGRWETAATQVEVLGVEAKVDTTGAVLVDGPMLLSVARAAEVLGIPEASLRGLVNSGEIDHVRIGRRRLISRDALSHFINTHTANGNQTRY